MRKCRRCGIDKELDEFLPNKDCKEGRTSTCRDCWTQGLRGRKLPDRKTCSHCKIEKPLQDFYMLAHGPHSWCAECCKQAAKDFNRSHPKAASEHGKKWRAQFPKRVWASRTFTQHRLNGKDIQVTTEGIELMALLTEWCPVCGIRLRYGVNSGKWLGALDNASLDQIDASKPLTKENIMIICFGCNSGKGNEPLDQYILRCARVTIIAFAGKKFQVKGHDHL